MTRDEFHKTWNPPHGDVSWNVLSGTTNWGFLKPESLYRFPWYLSPLYLWHGLVCYCKTGKWPMRILYFKDGQELDRELYPKVMREHGFIA